jgi:hypothetical protein
METWLSVEVLVSVLHFKMVQLEVQALAVVASTLQGAELPKVVPQALLEWLMVSVRLRQMLAEGPAVHQTCLEKLVGLVQERRPWWRRRFI